MLCVPPLSRLCALLCGARNKSCVQEVRSSWRREDSHTHTPPPLSLSLSVNTISTRWARSHWMLLYNITEAFSIFTGWYRRFCCLCLLACLFYVILFLDFSTPYPSRPVLLSETPKTDKEEGLLDTPPTLNLTSGYDKDSWSQFLRRKHTTEDSHIGKDWTVPRNGVV